MKQMESIAYQSVMAIKDQHLLVAVAACVELADELGRTTTWRALGFSTVTEQGYLAFGCRTSSRS
jgi:hypothetical protein